VSVIYNPRFQDSHYEVDDRFFRERSAPGCPSSGAVGEGASGQHSSDGGWKAQPVGIRPAIA
jgi:hypothetical protein